MTNRESKKRLPLRCPACDAQLGGGQVPDMAHAGRDLIVLAQIFANGIDPFERRGTTLHARVCKSEWQSEGYG